MCSNYLQALGPQLKAEPKPQSTLLQSTRYAKHYLRVTPYRSQSEDFCGTGVVYCW
jgi:hypothetical protein